MFAVEDRHWWYVGVRREVERWLRTLRPRPGERLALLDAGCGTGGLLANLDSTAWRAGVEISPEGIRRARTRGLTALVCGSVAALPFADDSFDAVVSIDVLCHSGVVERQAVEEAARVLRPGGLFLVQLPAFDFLRGEHDAAVWTKRRYRRGEVAALLTSAGLSMRRSAYRNAILFPLAVVARLGRRRRKARAEARSDVRPVPRPVNAILSAVLAVERRVGGRFPFGLSVFCVAEKPLEARDTISAAREERRMIPVWEPVLDGNEKRYVLDCLETNWISSLGSYLTRFEESVAAYCGVPHGVACSSCTTGLHLALVALGVGPGDEVLIPDFTLIVSANTVIEAGARPVLVDVDPKTWCIDPARLEEKIGPRTRAIMPVHMYGHPCDMPAIGEIARRHNLLVIEDCAEAHGAEIDGRKVGSFGDAACFSFYGNKILTTGEGGMVLCSDAALAAKLRLLRNQAFAEPRFVHAEIGYNYRLTNVQAAIGLAQSEKVVEKVEKKREIARWYAEAFANVPDVELPWEAPNAKNVYWMYGVKLGDSFRRGRDGVMVAMKEKGVETRAFFCPMHKQPAFAGDDPRFPDMSGEYPVSDDLWKRGLYLPSGLGLTRAQVEEVVEKLAQCRG